MNLSDRREFLLILGCSALARADAAPPIGVAFGTYAMKDLGTGEALRAIAQIGYDGVELAVMSGWPADSATLQPAARKELRRVLADTGLALPALQDSLPLLRTPAKRAENRQRLQRAMELAHELSPSKPACIDTILGLKSSDWETEKDRMLDELREWARLAESAGVTIGVKPHAAQALDTPEKALWLIHQINSPRIRLTYDYSHMFVGGFPLESSLRAMLPYTVLISLKDARGGPAAHTFLLPGDGETDYPSYFGLLKQLGYSGFVNVEVSSMIHRRPGYDPIATARLCYNRLSPAFVRALPEMVSPSCGTRSTGRYSSSQR